MKLIKQINVIIVATLLLATTACKKDTPEWGKDDKLAPTVTASVEGSAPTGVAIKLSAIVINEFYGTDIEKVEFFKGTTKLGEKKLAPFVWDYLVTENSPGQILEFTVKVTDKAGNSTISNKVTSVVSIRVEAENATILGVARAVFNVNGASNRGKVGYMDNPASGIDFVVNIPANGNYEFAIAAGTDFNDVTHKIYVDGNTAGGQIYNVERQGWDNWKKYLRTFTLTAGNHTISIRHNSWFGELDYVDISKK